MEAIKVIAERMKTGKYPIDLPSENTAAAITGKVIVEIEKKHRRLCR